MQPKRPRFNPLILALALAGVLMIWSVLGTSDSSTGGSTMSYSTVVHYFENNQVTAFTLDRNTSIITLTLKEGKQELPETTGATAATQASGGLLSNMFSSSTSSVGATRNDDGTVTVRYKLPYAYVFIENVQQYIDSYDAVNPTAPMEYDPMDGDPVLSGNAGLHRLPALLHDARRRWRRRYYERGQGQGEGRAREQKDRDLCRRCR